MTEPTEERDAWREALDRHLARQEHIRRLREQLAEARAAGKRIRHANRLRRARAGDTTSKESTE